MAIHKLLLLFGGILYFGIMNVQGEIPAEFIAYNLPKKSGAASYGASVTKGRSSKSKKPAPTEPPNEVAATDTASTDSACLGGSPGGPALEGTFYDLKLTRSGNPSKLAEVVTKDKEGKPLVKDGKPFKLILLKKNDGAEIMEILCRFFNGNWNPSVLSAYYSPKQKLYASAFYLPQAAAEYAPIAYRCSSSCQDAGWLAVYRGKVRAPKNGKFRFVGTGNDFLGVRFNKQTVLEAGYRIPSLYTKDDPRRTWVSSRDDRARYWQDIRHGRLKGFVGYELISTIKEIHRWNLELGGLTAGKVFEVREGEVYPIEIAISKFCGGSLGFVLLIEDVTNGKVPADGKYDLFRTNYVAPNKKDIFELLKKVHCQGQATSPEQLQAPPYNADSHIWTAVP